MESLKDVVERVARENPHFNEPWQADSFVMAVALSHAGAFTWPQWVAHFSKTIKEFPQRVCESTADAYYRQWLICFESLLTELGFVTPDNLSKRMASWEAAYRLTPHGSPVEAEFEAQKALEYAPAHISEIGRNAGSFHHDHNHALHHEHHHSEHQHVSFGECGTANGKGGLVIKPLRVFPKRVAAVAP